jgi:hypothetical protein
MIPTQKLLYQGFITDTASMRYYVSEEKVQLLQAELQHIVHWASQGTQLPARVLASMLGQIIALLRSHGAALRVLTRATQH